MDQAKPVTAVLVHHDTDLYDCHRQDPAGTEIIHRISNHLFWDRRVRPGPGARRGPPLLGQLVQRPGRHLPAAGRHQSPGHADRIVIETSWSWGEAVVQGLVTPDHIEVGKVVETGMPAEWNPGRDGAKYAFRS